MVQVFFKSSQLFHLLKLSLELYIPYLQYLYTILNLSFSITPFIVYFYIVYNIVNNAIFVLPAPVGAHTNKLLSFLYALLKTSDCILFNVFNFGKVSYAHAGNSLIDTNCSFSSN